MLARHQLAGAGEHRVVIGEQRGDARAELGQVGLDEGEERLLLATEVGE